jgi:hypothetical protein
MATSICVLNPAGLPVLSRWPPMTAPKIIATTIRVTTLAICLGSGRPDRSSSKIISIVDQSCFTLAKRGSLVFDFYRHLNLELARPPLPNYAGTA